MVIKKFIKANWLTRKPKKDGLAPTLALMILLLVTSFIYIHDSLDASDWMSATYRNIFEKKEYWRAWTTLFAHVDLTHILSNLLLFFPFSYYLIGYFGLTFFPFIGFFVGGLINLLVLLTMSPTTSLIGCSGVVNWMGGAWLLLSCLVDRRESKIRRGGKIVAVTIILFIPESLKPEVSYLAHFLGYFSGMISALIFYYIKRAEFIREEVIGVIIEPPVPKEKAYWLMENQTTDDEKTKHNGGE